MVRLHFIRDIVSSGKVKVETIASEENLADAMTKPLSSTKFRHCLDLISSNSNLILINSGAFGLGCLLIEEQGCEVKMRGLSASRWRFVRHDALKIFGAIYIRGKYVQSAHYE